jgi:hypothetical protein
VAKLSLHGSLDSASATPADAPPQDDNLNSRPELAGVVRVMMVARVMVMMLMVVTAGECGNGNHDHSDEQEWQKLFHAPDYSHAAAPRGFV